MSVTTDDRRVRRTRRLLHEAFINLVLEKGFDRLTVQDILDRADVGRSTFYSHFRDKEALLMSCFDDVRDGLRGEPGWPDPAAVIFRHAHRHRQVYQALCGRKGGAVVHRNLSRLIGEAVSDHLGPRLLAAGSQMPADVVTEFYVSATLGLLTWWIEHDFRYGPARMAAIQRRLVAPGIKAALTP